MKLRYAYLLAFLAACTPRFDGPVPSAAQLEWQRMERLKEKDNTIRFSVPEGAQEEVVV